MDKLKECNSRRVCGITCKSFYCNLDKKYISFLNFNLEYENLVFSKFKLEQKIFDVIENEIKLGLSGKQWSVKKN